MPKVLTASKAGAVPLDKIAARRAELVEAALETLAELGYARASLREIAQKSRFSHGVLHYYFDDKVDLISYCVRHYKAKCVKRYDRIAIDATSYEELVDKFLASLGQSLREEGKMYRLWYDLRSQALFEDAFRADVQAIDRSLEAMTWRVMSRALELKVADPVLSAPIVYATLDGLFQQALHRHLGGDLTAIAEMQNKIREFLPVCGQPRKRGTDAMLSRHQPKKRATVKARRASTHT